MKGKCAENERQKRRVLVYANGTLDPSFLDDIRGEDQIIGVDRAAFWLLEHGVVPDVAIGDFDSCTVSERRRIMRDTTHCYTYPQSKDSTDLELALGYAARQKPTSIRIFGAVGTRFDHTLAAAQLLLHPSLRPIESVLVTPTNEIRVLRGNLTLMYDQKFPYVSVLPVSKDVVVSINGCTYSGQNIRLQRGLSRGVSNEISGPVGMFRTHRGVAFIIRSADAPESPNT